MCENKLEIIAKGQLDRYRKLLLGNKFPKRLGFAIGILRSFSERCCKCTEHLADYQQSHPQYSYGYAKPNVAIGNRVRAYGL
jgi:hypothetical protein